MTLYYLYIKAGVQLDLDTRFYKVAVGEGLQGRKQNAWLEAFAVEHGHFYVRWSTDAVQFAIDCQNSIGADAAPMVSLPGSDLIKSLKNGCEDPACWQAIQHRHELMMRIDPNYYMYYQLGRK